MNWQACIGVHIHIHVPALHWNIVCFEQETFHVLQLQHWLEPYITLSWHKTVKSCHKTCIINKKQIVLTSETFYNNYILQLYISKSEEKQKLGKVITILLLTNVWALLTQGFLEFIHHYFRQSNHQGWITQQYSLVLAEFLQHLVICGTRLLINVQYCPLLTIFCATCLPFLWGLPFILWLIWGCTTKSLILMFIWWWCNARSRCMVWQIACLLQSTLWIIV